MRPDLLDSALARPPFLLQYREPALADLAVAYLLGIARNHPFEQGNKRTGFLAATTFLKANGYQLAVGDSEFIGEAITGALRDDITDAALASIFRVFVVDSD